MAKYVYDHKTGQMVDKETRAPMLSNSERAQPLQAPRVFGDYQGYASPITGEWIEGRRARNYDMAKHGCVDANDFVPEGGRKLKNERFAKKHNLEHMLE